MNIEKDSSVSLVLGQNRSSGRGIYQIIRSIY